ncbi:MAG TPA: hypothetical protein VM099_09855 [Gemmatimonadaceae bacterium]|nr:hypothetical protein [Gemmatimonadaceae bacterium]
MAAVIGPACGGPEIIDPGPTQSVAYYFAGTDETGALHVHVHWVQSKHALTLLSPCVPQDDCDIYAFNGTGITELGLTQPPFVVNLASGSGTFTDPGISFTITTVNGKTFNYTGTVVTKGDAVQMDGTLIGTNGIHPPSRLVLDRQL